MSLEDKLSKWTGPSSDTEQDKQDRTERMIRQAIDSHEPFRDCSLKVYAKGSYANNTNVRSDSDVDVAVECTEVQYWEESVKGNHTPGRSYEGIWTPAKLRAELLSALKAKFPEQVDSSGSTAIQINSNSARVDADVVPCFSYRYYMKSETRDGTKIFKTDGGSIVNYPAQQMENGTAKNKRTGYAYKKGVRLLKRIENAMAEDGTFRELPSFFMECLAYNCPDTVFTHSTWTDCLRAMLFHIWDKLQGDEPDFGRWVEVNECFFLFHANQKWTREDGREFAKAAWNYFGFK
ncbi:nucleotidyltransferase [Escherichia coli]|uniref:nucleotidyltransferase domain-containing protein n=1 Tax=Escherichia coli TaxID=562 RepID=UPI000B7D1310|nr:nucleotidyltransferase [Escherichia coli]EFE9446763.1 nucleotidyltransferase [Escherichia coli]EGA2503451.1 nucleotidyltransferase [Escherichia coli]EHR7905193.1 nucleotidyltransferase [Escherichia coli]MBB7889867.1 nucleotidyltransferase [Escherichia coli]MCV1865217.1 nucleotidyltransferase [Escherichia coli]